jgi:hypothetical protein
MDERKQIPIWFFVGGLLLIYGIIITVMGVYNLFPGHARPGVVLQWLHADLWWGLLLIALGGFYTLYYFPSQNNR